MRKVLVALVVIAALAVGLDRGLVIVAENVVASRIQESTGLDRQPAVDIRGLPFLTQAVGGTYRHVTASLPALQRGDVRLENLVVNLRDVRAPLVRMLRTDRPITARAASVTASATVPYALVEARAPGDMRASPAGQRLRLFGNTGFLGRDISGSALVEVSPAAGGLELDATRVRLQGRPAPARLADRLSFTIDVGELPFGLRITGAQVTRKGVRVRAGAENVPLTGPRAAVGE